MRTILQQLLPWLIILAFIATVEGLLGWQTLLASWQQLSWQTGVIAIALMVLSYGLRTWRFYDYFRLGQQPPNTMARPVNINDTNTHPSSVSVGVRQTARQFAYTFRLMLLHNLFNNVLPARSGELSFPLLMKRYFALDYSRTVSALLWFRLLDLHSILLMLSIPVLAWFLPTSLALLLSIGFLLIPWVAFRLQCKLSHYLQQKSQNHTENPALWLKWGLKIIRGLPTNPHDFWRSWLLTLLNWAVKLGILVWLLLQLSNIPIPVDIALSAIIGGELTSVLPFHAPAGVGTYEAGLVAVLSTTNALPWLPLHGTLSVQAAMILAINVHLFVLSTAMMGGLLAWLLPKPTSQPTEIPELQQTVHHSDDINSVTIHKTHEKTAQPSAPISTSFR
ncbi:MAG: lysylphosphatidylglycerol synthase transmembrane domain-containing protein [bacterium]